MGNVVLGLLMLSPFTLYALSKQFEQGISLFYSASLGSLRTAIVSLLDQGLVEVAGEVEGGRNKKTYTITDAGRAAFRDWMLAPITGGNAEIGSLSRLYFLGLLDPAERQAVLDNILERATADEQQLLDLGEQLDAMEVPEQYREVFRYQRLTLDYGIRSHRVAREFFEGVPVE